MYIVLIENCKPEVKDGFRNNFVFINRTRVGRAVLQTALG